MAEVMDEATYVAHHKQKFVLVFSAMRQFAERLRARGIEVRYVRLGDPAATSSLNGEVLRALETGDFSGVVITEAGEWRLAAAFDDLAHIAPVPVEIRPDTRFVCSHAVFDAWAAERSELRMEFFYRQMRRATGLLMDGDKPAGGRWNFDPENRKRPPKGYDRRPRTIIAPNPVTPDTLAEMAARFPDNFGALERFGYATNAGRGRDGPRRFPDARPAAVRRLPGLHARRRAVDVARPHLGGDEPRACSTPSRSAAAPRRSGAPDARP